MRVAEAFLGWVREHGLAGELTVDEVWFYASEDLCPARGLVLPKRQTFLAELRRLAGVKVMHDRRVRAKDGTVKGKTTVYMLPANDAVAELEPIRLAA